LETIHESIEIRAHAATVFALVADLCRRARLNPAWTVISCEALDGEPLRAGARYRFLIRRGDDRVEHRSRVIEFDPPQLLRMRSEVHSDLEILLAVQPSGAGCILSHTEAYRSPPIPPVLAQRHNRDSFRNMVKSFVLTETGDFSMPDAVTWQEAFRKQVRIEIRAWLERIREEAERGAADRFRLLD
jgi:hypothetical protein